MFSRTQKMWFVLAVMPVLSLVVAGCGDAQPKWVSLFNGQDLNGWKARDTAIPNAWQSAAGVKVDPKDATKLIIEPGKGVLVNGPAGRTTDIYTAEEFGDMEAHVEFLVPKGSNSGIYIMGEYELQVLDSFGRNEVTPSDCGGIYSRWVDEKEVDGHAPRINASNPPGTWQSFDIVFRAPRFDAGGKKTENARIISVRLNGKLIHENVTLNGPTRAGRTDRENPPQGPLMLQGDHGPVAYRNIRIKRLDSK